MEFNVIHRGFVFDASPTPMCHASTILPLCDGRVLAAWFGGSREGEDDVAIWSAIRIRKRWSNPRVIMQGAEPCWNPVLHDLGNGHVALYYKVGREISRWRTLVSYSNDLGDTWSLPEELVSGDEGGRGPVRSKVIRLQSGRLLAPASIEHGIWEAFVDRSDDNGENWIKSNYIGIDRLHYTEGERTSVDSDIEVDEQSFYGRGVIQPTLWESKPGCVHMLLRSTQRRIYRSDSEDGGAVWRPAYKTSLPNNNSGIDLVCLDNGALVLAYNPIDINWGPRSPLTLAVSTDNGAAWSDFLILDSGVGEFAYPAVTALENTLHITYTWKRKNIAYWQIAL